MALNWKRFWAEAKTFWAATSFGLAFKNVGRKKKKNKKGLNLKKQHIWAEKRFGLKIIFWAELKRATCLKQKREWGTKKKKRCAENRRRKGRGTDQKRLKQKKEEGCGAETERKKNVETEKKRKVWRWSWKKKRAGTENF